MMRILLASGEEAVYRTVEELAMGISSGTITAGARFFDPPSQDWRAIDAHPEYHEAVARAANFGPGLELEPPSGSHAAPVMPEIQPERHSGSFQIYQMFSLSAAELQARKRPAWLLPGLAGVGAVLLLVSLVALYLGNRPGPSVGEDPPALAVSTVEVSSPRLPAPSSVEAMRLAPMNLNSHQTFAFEAAGRRLRDSVAALGARALLSRGRQLSPDSVRRTLDLLVDLRRLVNTYRTAQQQTQRAYRDTAAMLVKSGFWSRVDQQEWKVYLPASESHQEAAQADTILASLESLYGLLEEQPHGYREVAGHIRFDDSATHQQYERLRAVLARYEGMEEINPARITALTVLRGAAVPSTATSTSRPYSLP